MQDHELKKRLILVFGRQTFAAAAFCDRLGGEFPEQNVVAASAANMLVNAAASQIDLVIITASAASQQEDMDVLSSFLAGLPKQPPTVIMGDIGFRMRGTFAQSSNLKGIFPDYATVNVVVAGLRFILEGGEYFPNENNKLVQEERQRLPPDGAFGQASSSNAAPAAFGTEPLAFTSREQAVLEALSKGLSNKAIARDLNVAENTVKVHVRGILRKLNVSNRTEAVISAQRLQLTNVH